MTAAAIPPTRSAPDGSSAAPFAIERFEGHEAVLARIDDLLRLCREMFGDYPDERLTDRLDHVEDLLLHLALDEQGEAIGFKFGHREGAYDFYSWLGGVARGSRRQGVATALMQAQHRDLAARGYRNVTTKTRGHNRAMLIANLRAGFEVCGFEINELGVPMVRLRCALEGR